MTEQILRLILYCITFYEAPLYFSEQFSVIERSELKRTSGNEIFVSYQMCVAFEAFLSILWQVIIACSDYQKTTIG